MRSAFSLNQVQFSITLYDGTEKQKRAVNFSEIKNK
jgi:hypothetical protein